MKISILELTDTNIKIRLNAPVSFANAIRRVILSEVSSYAIDQVEIEENKTVLADEMLVHRLGLIPIMVHKDLIFKEDCDCNSYCSRCSVILQLNCVNTSSSVINITGKNIVVCEDVNVDIHDSFIVKLAPQHCLKLKCIVRRGYAKNHVKYCPAAIVSFSYDKRNATRATSLWYEEDPVKEWPKVNQEPNIDWKDPDDIEMNIEVVEGTYKPKDLLVSALNILRNKFQSILELAE